ncbi:hypothetical protein OG311_37840 (plasmid) [Streptomyces sp. NBC_01343]|uniref:hypothetical protein n=1 Tax=Streptomyces sp. NBC_01343 TaxID=2903832 RepID=UPI002E0E246D|nr:hypothetical protein OG311_37840 [Streptomyces sp. NBC_01343]
MNSYMPRSFFVRLVLAGTDDVEASDRRAAALRQRIRGSALRIDIALLPELLAKPSTEWMWHAIGQHDEQGPRPVA